jgi:hypothetical protein
MQGLLGLTDSNDGAIEGEFPHAEAYLQDWKPAVGLVRIWKHRRRRRGRADATPCQDR